MTTDRSLPSNDIKVHLERIRANSIEDGMHSSIDTFSSGDFVDLFRDVTGAVVEEDVLRSCLPSEFCLLLSSIMSGISEVAREEGRNDATYGSRGRSDDDRSSRRASLTEK